ncbi:MAG: toll/interleukin-1 receptor domain-containing protein, partial [Cyanobacteria bacterium P01_F01_bin.116]
PIQRDQVFISYSHKDRQWLEKLQIYLKPVIRKKQFKVWDDTKIQPGAEWRKEIEKALDAAKVAVLMVSANFLSSDFIDKNELPPLLEAAQNEGLQIVWVLVSDCMYEESEIEKYQAAHSLDKPLITLTDAEEPTVLKSICKIIKEFANS